MTPQAIHELRGPPCIKPEIIERLLRFAEIHDQSEDADDRAEAAALAMVCNWLKTANPATIKALIADYERMRGALETTGSKAVVRSGQIVISIDVDALPLILSGSISSGEVLHHPCKVVDPEAFAKEVCRALNRESENGTTPVHIMFDKAFEHAIEYGAEGVDECTEEEFEAESARLQSIARQALTQGESA